jgi:hypothetical protein
MAAIITYRILHFYYTLTCQYKFSNIFEGFPTDVAGIFWKNPTVF